MKLRPIREAEAELADAIARYEFIEPGLGVRLKEEARLALAWIAANPEFPRLRPKGYRRFNLRIFPYYIAYLTAEALQFALADLRSNHERYSEIYEAS